jgi:hypothetical protein
VLPGPGPARAGHHLDPASGQVLAAVGLPGRPLAVGAGPGAVWVRGPEGWLWRVNPAYTRRAGAMRLPTMPGGTELAGEVVVAAEVLWVSDPGAGVVRRVDLRGGTEQRREVDGRDLAATSDGTVWATSDTRLLGLGAPRCVALAGTCTSRTLIGSPPWRLLRMAGCGWARPTGCSMSTSTSCTSDSPAGPRPPSPPDSGGSTALPQLGTVAHPGGLAETEVACRYRLLAL